MPSTVTVHYRFHPLHNRSLKVVAWPRRAGIAATVRDPGGKALKIPRWMLEPEAVHHRLGDRVELPVSVLRALAAQLPSCLKIPATPPPEHNDAANEPRSRHRSGCRRRSGDGSGTDPTADRGGRLCLDRLRAKLRRRKCLNRRQLFRSDPRTVRHQRYCSAPPCRKASKTRWLSKPQNRSNFRGPEHVAPKHYNFKLVDLMQLHAVDSISSTKPPQPGHIEYLDTRHFGRKGRLFVLSAARNFNSSKPREFSSLGCRTTRGLDCQITPGIRYPDDSERTAGAGIVRASSATADACWN